MHCLAAEDGFHNVMNDLEGQIRVAVAAWARDVFQTDEVVVGEIAFEEEEERYLADVALREVSEWRVAEVCVEAGTVVLVNDLGEGHPMDDAPWPWTGDGA